jgi:hypothetical protein
MLLDNLLAFLTVFVRPTAAFSRLIDVGNWIFAVLAVLVVSVALHYGLNQRIYDDFQHVQMKYAVEHDSAWGGADEDVAPPEVYYVTKPLPVIGALGWRFLSFSSGDAYFTVLNLLVLYVPATVFALTFFAYIGSFSVAIQQSYGPLLTCTCAAWVVSHLPGVALGLIFPTTGGALAFYIWVGCTAYFTILMIFAIRTVFGVKFLPALWTISVSWMSLLVSGLLFALMRPFLLLYLIPLALAAFAGLRSAHLSQQRFRQNLETATINPRDAEAHLQLGLMYQQRRQFPLAMARFRKAVEIDPREPDANYRLGQIAREQGRLPDALAHFEIVVSQDDKFSTSEIWREIGATYLAAGMLDEARTALEKFTDRRPFDPEGLYFLGEVHRTTGNPTAAREFYERAIEAVATMPHKRRAETRQWRDLAKARLK